MIIRLAALTGLLCAAQLLPAMADPITVTDVAGREVTVEAPATVSYTHLTLPTN